MIWVLSTALTPTNLRADEQAAVRAAEIRENLRTCLSGRYPSLCKHELLDRDSAKLVLHAEKTDNLRTCLTGRYPSLCKHELLDRDSVKLVLDAEKTDNLRTCLTGRYPSLCKHELLDRDSGESVLGAEKRENLKICLDGRYPSLCNHELLRTSDATTIAGPQVSESGNLTYRQELFGRQDPFVSTLRSDENASEARSSVPSIYPSSVSYTGKVTRPLVLPTSTMPRSAGQPPLPPVLPRTVYVNGYVRRNGTYVAPHYRSAPRR